MSDLVRREVIETARTVVVKVGTNVLSRDDDSLDVARLEHLAEQIAIVRETGRQVVVVSSGAVGAGMGLLGLKERPKDLAHLQAAASAGQAHLIRLYDDCLRKHGTHAAQVLLTANDFRSRARYLNVRNTLLTLFEYGVVPIVNENDTVSIDEIKFGDNDQLGALVAALLRDALLVVLSIVDGLFDGDPNEESARRIPLVDRWDENLTALARPVTSSRGTGGMHSKLDAVRTATAVGENVIITDGTRERVLEEILAGGDLGTLFLAQGSTIPAWKRWIGYTVSPAGRLVLDAGAVKAVRDLGKSLLAAGILRAEGDFKKGELVSLCDEHQTEFARGLTNYDAEQSRMITGKNKTEIAAILGSLPYAEVIHRDNLVVIGG